MWCLMYADEHKNIYVKLIYQFNVLHVLDICIFVRGWLLNGLGVYVSWCMFKTKCINHVDVYMLTFVCIYVWIVRKIYIRIKYVSLCTWKYVYMSFRVLI